MSLLSARRRHHNGSIRPNESQKSLQNTSQLVSSINKGMSEVAWPSEIEKKSTVSKEVREEQPSTGFASFWPSQQNKAQKKKAEVILEDYSDQGSNEGEIDWLNIGKKVPDVDKSYEVEPDQRPIRPKPEADFSDDRPIKPMKQNTFDERPIKPKKEIDYDDNRPIKPQT